MGTMYRDDGGGQEWYARAMLRPSVKTLDPLCIFDALCGMSDELQTIRQIGWHIWDPIGLMGANDPPAEALDEYDSYLLQAVAMLRAGDPLQDVIATLVDIESEQMGLGEAPDIDERATQTVLELRQVILTP